MTTNTVAMRVAAGAGLLAVGLGAFGAHGLREILARHDMTAAWETAVFYHCIHAVMLFVLAARTPFVRGPWICFLAGTILFSGSLYVMALTRANWLGPVTPVGGAGLIVGWLWLAIAPSGRKPEARA